MSERLATVEVAGAVIVPSYVIAPIAGESYSLMFGLSGVCMAIAAVLVACLGNVDGAKG